MRVTLRKESSYPTLENTHVQEVMFKNETFDFSQTFLKLMDMFVSVMRAQMKLQFRWRIR